jgi:dipeptidyl aminopeptidase/acylaminoacyl peptidase
MPLRLELVQASLEVNLRIVTFHLNTQAELVSVKILRASRSPIHSFAYWVSLLALFLAVPSNSHGQTAGQEVITPPNTLVTDGVPSVPARIAQDVRPYVGMYGLPLAGWDPIKRELQLKGVSSVTWISNVEAPGSTPKITTYIQSGGIYDVYYQPQGKYLAYTRDSDGNEAFQLYLYNLQSKASTLLSDGKSRNTEPVWAPSGERIIYSSSPVGTVGVSLRVINPFDPKSDRLLVQTAGGYLKAYDWSPDNKLAVYCDFTSNTVSSLWMVDVETGAKTRLSPQTARDELYDFPQFSRDGKGVYVVTDHDSDVRRLAYLDLQTKQFKYLSDGIKWDVDEFRLSPDGKALAFVINEEGNARLRLLVVATGQERQVPQLPVGLISDLKWDNNSTDLAFNYKSPRTPNDAYSININTGKIDLWARSTTNGVDTQKFSLPEVIHWKTFDGRTLPGYLYRPPTKFTGKRPVIIDVHGGPEEQYRPGFGYEDNYFLNELGVVKIYPNVRGSTGFGRAFLELDNGLKREDAVRDVGALLDWIKAQPDLDSDRVMVEGASYGGFIALSVAVNYGDRIRAALSDSGPSNLATFVESTEGWRRGLQRAEFGDERDLKVREFMERTAPLRNAQKIKKPLMVIQGQNDPRVPVSESESIIKATKGRIPVWYLLAKNEGHGFVQQNNRDYRLYSTILFVKEFLLK